MKKQYQDQNTGPKIFLNRLLSNLDIPENVKVYNPDNISLKNAKMSDRKREIILARLDGAYFYKFTFKELLGFFSKRGYLDYRSNNIGGSIEPSRILTILLNKRLNYNSRWLIDNSDGVVFQSKLSKNMHDKFTGTAKLRNFVIINNGVDLDRFKPTLKEGKWKGYFPNIIISASTYRPNKRLTDAIKLTNILSRHFPNICLHVLGDISKEVKEEITTQDTKRCKFHGRIEPSLLPKFYSSCDMQFHLGIFDPCPNVVVEGLASGLPVITPEESGTYELIQSNVNWSVKENKELDFYENHRPGVLQIIDLEPYIQKIISVIEDISFHKNVARSIAEENLDIIKISEKYENFIRSTQKLSS